eukprot:CAMPEP_0178429330 /NCGR_PEP_ID=MMETSP0689_2-20121128/30745_1 /TAXON_ID=160604 /ORGANISM="Amphidinium massartii, Strain CS-259" /LENGTH=1109 /DNA_ID=CAMNT_0020051145 /DNA_START=88 /DNA_END=3415 /DNA_ORIENTATION=+
MASPSFEVPHLPHLEEHITPESLRSAQQRHPGGADDYYGLDANPSMSLEEVQGSASSLRRMLMVTVAGNAANSALVAAGQLGELRKLNSERNPIVGLARERVASKEAERLRAERRADEALRKERQASMIMRQKAATDWQRQSRSATALLRSREAGMSASHGLARERLEDHKRLLLDAFARAHSRNSDSQLLSCFVSWRCEVESQRCARLEDALREAQRRQHALELADQRARQASAASRVGIAFGTLELEKAMLQGFAFALWKSSARKSRSAANLCRSWQRTSERSMLQAVIASWRQLSLQSVSAQNAQARGRLVQELMAARVEAAVLSCWSSWRAQAQAGAAAARSSRQQLQQKRTRLETCEAILEPQEKRHLQLVQSSCFSSWRSIAAAQKGEQAAVMRADSATASAQLLQARGRKACERVLASLLAERCQLILVGAFACWSVFLRLAREHGKIASTHSADATLAGDLLLHRRRSSSRLLARLLATSLEQIVAGAFACWQAALRVQRREGSEVAATEHHQDQLQQRHGEEVKLHLGVAQRRLQASTGAIASLIARQMELLLMAAFLSWVAVAAHRSDAKPEAAPTAFLADEAALHLGIAHRRLQASSGAMASLIARHLELLQHAAFRAWLTAAGQGSLRLQTAIRRGSMQDRKSLSSALLAWRIAALGNIAAQSTQARGRLVHELMAARMEATVLSCWSCWRAQAQDGATEARSSRALLLQQQSELKAQQTALVKDESEVAAVSAQLLLQVRRSRACEHLLGSLISEKWQLTLLGAFAFWSLAAKTGRGEQVSTDATALAPSPAAAAEGKVLLRRSCLSSKLLARSIAACLESILVGAFACWRAALRATARERLVHQESKVMMQRNSLTSRLVARLMAASMERTVAGAFACWSAAMRLKEELGQKQAPPSPSLTPSQPQEQQSLANQALVQQQHRSTSRLLARFMAASLEQLVVGAFACWKAVVVVSSKSLTSPTASASVHLIQHSKEVKLHLGVAQRRLQASSSAIASLIARQMELLLMASFRSWLAVVVQSSAAVQAQTATKPSSASAQNAEAEASLCRVAGSGCAEQCIPKGANVKQKSQDGAIGVFARSGKGRASPTCLLHWLA